MRAFIRGIGQTMVTLGLVVLLFVVYELWVTNIYAHAKQVKAHNTLTRVWKEHKDPLKGEDRAKLPAGKQVVLPAGQGFANLYIPRLGKDYAYTIIEGTTEDDLARGPGHYEGSAIPGQIGNFAVAGHRVTHGQPFLNADQIKVGDPIVVQTDHNWYIYRVLGNAEDRQAGGEELPGRARARDRRPVRRRRGRARARPLRRTTEQGLHDHDHVQPEVLSQPADGHPLAAGPIGEGIRHQHPQGNRRNALMYTFIWRHLPGPMPIRLFQVLILVAIVSAVLLFVVFPWAEPHLPLDHVTVDGN